MRKRRLFVELTGVLVGILCFAACGRTANAQLYSSHVLYTIPPGVTPGAINIDGSLGGSIATSSNGNSAFATWTPTGTATIFNSASDPFPVQVSLDGQIYTGNLIGGSAAPNGHAVLLNTTLDTVTDLNPPNLVSSLVTGINNGQEVGWGLASGRVVHALLWTGTAASVVDLTPLSVPGSASSGAEAVALATDGAHQVGEANEFAAYWSGSAASYQKLQPLANNTNDELAVALSGDQIVGWVDNPGLPETFHALYWNGVGAAPVDLTPSQDFYSRALGVNASQQVGFIIQTSTDPDNAAVWSGTADSVVDLQQFVPGTYSGSVATTIDAAGNIFGFANDAAGDTAVIEWTPVPEPTFVLPSIAITALLASRRQRPARGNAYN